MGAADTKPHHATSTIAQPSPSIRFMASGFRCCGHHAIMMSFGCCPLFAVAVGSVSCFMLCVSVSAFCGSGILMACGHCTQACPLRAPTGVVCVFFPHACHVFLPVGLPAGLLCFLLCLLVVFLLWLFAGCVVFLLVLSCFLAVVCLLFVCWFAGLCLFSAVLQGFQLFGLSCLLCGVRVSEGAEM